MKQSGVRPLLILVVILASGCDAFTDPAVRVATCLEKAAASLKRSSGATSTSPCDVALEGSYVLVLHPDGELPDTTLLEAGLPKTALSELRALRLGPNESVYVIPLEGHEPPSRTTYQARFVSIPKLLVKVNTNRSVSLTVGRTGSDIAVLEVQ